MPKQAIRCSTSDDSPVAALCTALMANMQRPHFTSRENNAVVNNKHATRSSPVELHHHETGIETRFLKPDIPNPSLVFCRGERQVNLLISSHVAEHRQFSDQGSETDGATRSAPPSRR
jgi:hypothetical protein